MLQNKDIETLRMLFSSHNYVMTTAELTASKLYYADIKQLLDEGLIERVRRGYYHWTQDYGESEVVIINRLFPDAVLCMETALFYYRYSDRNPAEWNFAIDKNVSKRRTKIDYPFIKAYRVESELVTLGETEGEIDFHKVRIYDRDRTICDVLRNMNKMDKEVFNKAVQGYVKDPKKNIPNLIEYAKVLRVQTRVELFLSDEGQVIVGTERETGLEGKASNVIKLTEKRRCLNTINYSKHLELLEELQKTAISWVAFNHKAKNEK